MKKREKYVLIDLETSGLSPEKDEIIRFTAMRTEGDVILFDEYAKPKRRLSIEVETLTGILDRSLEYCSLSNQVKKRFLKFIKGYIVIGTNISFMEKFLGVEFKRKIELLKININEVKNISHK